MLVLTDDADLAERGMDVIGGGTDTPLMLVDVGRRGLTGAAAEDHLEAAGLTCNKNPVPRNASDPAGWTGLRFGVSAGTTRGFGTEEFRAIGGLVAEVIDDAARAPQVRAWVTDLCPRFPIYPNGWDQDDHRTGASGGHAVTARP